MPHPERSRAGSIVAIGSIGGVEDTALNAYSEVSYGAIKAALHLKPAKWMALERNAVIHLHKDSE